MRLPRLTFDDCNDWGYSLKDAIHIQQLFKCFVGEEIPWLLCHLLSTYVVHFVPKTELQFRAAMACQFHGLQCAYLADLRTVWALQVHKEISFVVFESFGNAQYSMLMTTGNGPPFQKGKFICGRLRRPTLGIFLNKAQGGGVCPDWSDIEACWHLFIIRPFGIMHPDRCKACHMK